MALEEFRFKGKTLEEVQKMEIAEFTKLLPARPRRSLQRELLKRYKPLMTKIEKTKKGAFKRQLKTHARDMVVLPFMVGMTFHIYNGKEFIPVVIIKEMLGHYLGEFAATRKKVAHSAPGIGATKSSTAAASKAK